MEADDLERRAKSFVMLIGMSKRKIRVNEKATEMNFASILLLEVYNAEEPYYVDKIGKSGPIKRYT